MQAYTLKEYLQRIFNGYRKMNSKLQKCLVGLGIDVCHGKKHIRLYRNNKLVSIPSTSSDVRAGRNIASIVFKNLFDSVNIIITPAS